MGNDREYLLDILVAARLALAYLKDKTEEEFFQDTECQDAVIRRLEVIGEAARRVSVSTRSSLPNLAWDEMIAMRNVMIHKYDHVDLTIVWDTVRNNLPELIETLEKIVPPER